MAIDKQNKKATHRLIMSIVMLVAATALFVSVCFAWFITGNNARGNDFELVTNSMKVKFGDTISFERNINGIIVSVTYVVDTDGVYYEYANGAYVLDEEGDKKPVGLTGLLPGETIDVALSFTAEDLKAGDDFTFIFGVDQISGDTFAYKSDNDSDIVNYSALGVFCVQSYDNGILNADKQWLCDYSKTDESGNHTVINSAVQLASGSWLSSDKTDGYVELKFRLSLDLEQYNAAHITQSNLLSEKNINIGRMFLWVNA